MLPHAWQNALACPRIGARRRVSITVRRICHEDLHLPANHRTTNVFLQPGETLTIVLHGRQHPVGSAPDPDISPKWPGKKAAFKPIVPPKDLGAPPFPRNFL